MEIIRKVRKEKKITLDEVSKATGFTKSYISQIERGLKQPAIESLRKICTYLEIPVNLALANFEESVRQADCILITSDSEGRSYSLQNRESGVVVKTLSPDLGMSGLRAYRITVPVGLSVSGGMISHPYEELMYVIAGKVEAHINQSCYAMRAQDSLYIVPMALHNIYNVGSEPAELLFTFHD